MGKIIVLVFSTMVLFGNDSDLNTCKKCHDGYGSPPYNMIYKRYLLYYSSKASVEKAMVDFLQAPSREKSAMPEGMKRRFHPEKHPAYNVKIAKKAVKYIIEKEDVIQKLKLSP